MAYNICLKEVSMLTCHTQAISSSLEIIRGPIVLYDTDGYYRPRKAVLDNILCSEFGRKDYKYRARKPLPTKSVVG